MRYTFPILIRSLLPRVTEMLRVAPPTFVLNGVPCHGIRSVASFDLLYQAEQLSLSSRSRFLHKVHGVENGRDR